MAGIFKMCLSNHKDCYLDLSYDHTKISVMSHPEHFFHIYAGHFFGNLFILYFKIITFWKYKKIKIPENRKSPLFCYAQHYIIVLKYGFFFTEDRFVVEATVTSLFGEHRHSSTTLFTSFVLAYFGWLSPAICPKLTICPKLRRA